MLGRDLLWDEEKPGHRAVMLSYALWQSRFGGDPQIAGKPITLDAQQYTIVGVMPATFNSPPRPRDPGLHHPGLEHGRQEPPGKQRGWNQVSVLARLAPGVDITQARAEMQTIQRSARSQYPDDNAKETAVSVVPELQLSSATSSARSTSSSPPSPSSCSSPAPTSQACCSPAPPPAVQSSPSLRTRPRVRRSSANSCLNPSRSPSSAASAASFSPRSPFASHRASSRRPSAHPRALSQPTRPPLRSRRVAPHRPALRRLSCMAKRPPRSRDRSARYHALEHRKPLPEPPPQRTHRRRNSPQPDPPRRCRPAHPQLRQTALRRSRLQRPASSPRASALRTTTISTTRRSSSWINSCHGSPRCRE